MNKSLVHQATGWLDSPLQTGHCPRRGTRNIVSQVCGGGAGSTFLAQNCRQGENHGIALAKRKSANATSAAFCREGFTGREKRNASETERWASRKAIVTHRHTQKSRRCLTSDVDKIQKYCTTQFMTLGRIFENAV